MIITLPSHQNKQQDKQQGSQQQNPSHPINPDEVLPLDEMESKEGYIQTVYNLLDAAYDVDPSVRCGLALVAVGGVLGDGFFKALVEKDKKNNEGD